METETMTHCRESPRPPMEPEMLTHCRDSPRSPVELQAEGAVCGDVCDAVVL